MPPNNYKKYRKIEKKKKWGEGLLELRARRWRKVEDEKIYELFSYLLRYRKLLQFDWLRAVVFQLNLKYLHVKITNLLLVVVYKI